MSISGTKAASAALITVLLLSCTEGITDNGGPDPVPDTACAPTTVASPSPPDLALELVSEGVHRPTGIAFPPGDSRIYMTQQFDGLRVLEADGSVHPLMVVDMGGQVSTEIEQGVLGLAFDPDFEENRFFYLTYTDLDGDLHLARYDMGDDPYTAEEQSVLLTVPQPAAIHQSGYLDFGPDGMLYMGLGDGGTPYDEAGHGQDPGTLLATILRIDVSGGGPYTIPPDNPFVGNPDGRDEVWAYGLRNPWSFSFDEEGGCLYIADVGEVLREEVNAVRSDLGGLNFGWNRMEGSVCTQPHQPDQPADSCDTTGLVLPVVDYNSPPCRAVIGGHAYRGSEISGLEGAFLYVDFCDDWVRSFRLEDNLAVQKHEWTFPEIEHVVDVGRDPSGELYFLMWYGSLYKLVEAS